MQRAERLRVVDPAEELPDRPEVLDVVDQRGAGERHQQRPGGAGADPLREREDVLGALRALVLDEVRLVDDHAAEAEVAEPADVPVQELVVHDHDVREPVDPVAVAMDHRGPALRRPQPDLVRPVRLHHVGHHDQQRVGVGRLGGEQRLGGLAEPGLVGEQERAVPAGRRRDDLGLVRHQLPAVRERAPARASGSGMQAGAPGPAYSKDRKSGSSSSQPASRRAARRDPLGRGLEVRGQERVRELARDHRPRHHPASRRRAPARPAAAGAGSSGGSSPPARITVAL